MSTNIETNATVNETLSVPPGPSTQETSFQPLPQTQLQSQSQQYRSTEQNVSINITTTTFTSSKPTSTKPPRILAPDLLRGLLILLQSLDHAAVTSGAWAHGTAIVSESSAHVFTRWNHTIPWTVRMLTHLCAPGFMFLLGMGIVYFGTSRGRLGWSSGRMVRHFFVRAVVLAAVNEVMGLLVIRRWDVLLNIVLLALAVNYFVVGVAWLGLRWVEGRIGSLVLRFMEKGGVGREGIVNDDADDVYGDGETRPLLSTRGGGGDGMESGVPKKTTTSIKVQATMISFHIINVFLLVLVVVTIWWNIWLSPTHGHCTISTTPHMSTTGIESSSSIEAPKPTPIAMRSLPSSLTSNPLFAFLFYEVSTQNIISPFPPLAWISFCLLGVLYARILLLKSQTWSTPRINLLNFILGASLLLLFVSTRFLHYGNLEEGCLQMPEQLSHPGKNQYLVGGIKSFMYVTKYPPSPSFGMYTMGINFLFLALFGFIPSSNKISTVSTSTPSSSNNDNDNKVKVDYTKFFPLNVLLTFGTCALFFYALHLPLYGLLGRAVKAIWGHQMDWRDNWGRGGDWAIGISLPVFVVDWLVGLVVLWALCRWYTGFKGSKGVDSLWRFF